MTTRTFTHDELKELDLDWRDHGGLIVSCESIDKARWYTLMRIVFEHDGSLWEIFRMDPATEMQEGQDIWDMDPVTAYQVEPYEATVTKYPEGPMTIPDLEPADLTDPDLDDLLARHDAQVRTLLLRREQLAFQLRHSADIAERATEVGVTRHVADDDLATELAIVNEELAAMGVEL